jgi:hypothetical protein
MGFAVSFELKAGSGMVENRGDVLHLRLKAFVR